MYGKQLSPACVTVIKCFTFLGESHSLQRGYMFQQVEGVSWEEGKKAQSGESIMLAELKDEI